MNLKKFQLGVGVAHGITNGSIVEPEKEDMEAMAHALVELTKEIHREHIARERIELLMSMVPREEDEYVKPEPTVMPGDLERRKPG